MKSWEIVFFIVVSVIMIVSQFALLIKKKELLNGFLLLCGISMFLMGLLIYFKK